MAAKLQLLLRQLKTSRVVPAVVLALALAILGGTIYLGATHLRRHLHEHMIARDGEILHAVALSRQFSAGSTAELSQRLRQPVEQLQLALSISQLRDGVLAVRLFNPTGQFVTAFPLNVTETNLPHADLPPLQQLQAISHYRDTSPLSDIFWLPPDPANLTQATPLLYVNIPIHARGERHLIGVAQLVLDGRPLQTEFAGLDQHLWTQALIMFLGGAVLLTGALLWAYRALLRANLLLQERSADLLRANHELTLAAKTNALGAVTAHLIHGLSNPLASLQDIVAQHQAQLHTETDWLDVVASTRRMQTLVQEVVRVLGEQNGSDQYELSAPELVDVLVARTQPLAQEYGVHFQTTVQARGILGNREANLVLLILHNLIQNAVQVTPRGRTVRLEATRQNGALFFEVSDQGPGFPAHLHAKLFSPCRSTKGGTGLGLAISRQLAQQLGADLELKCSSPDGCVFGLTLPRTLLDHPEKPDAVPASA